MNPESSRGHTLFIVRFRKEAVSINSHCRLALVESCQLLPLIAEGQKRRLGGRIPFKTVPGGFGWQ